MRGIRQAKLAELLGLSPSSLSRIENGSMYPTAVQWFLFCRLLEISPDDFYGVIAKQESTQLKAIIEDAFYEWRVLSHVPPTQNLPYLSNLIFENTKRFIEAIITQMERRQQVDQGFCKAILDEFGRHYE
jgi:transcriptional regulator with XRE-family HTH domain